jgi:hypothetical protein
VSKYVVFESSGATEFTEFVLYADGLKAAEGDVLDMPDEGYFSYPYNLVTASDFDRVKEHFGGSFLEALEEMRSALASLKTIREALERLKKNAMSDEEIEEFLK